MIDLILTALLFIVLLPFSLFTAVLIYLIAMTLLAAPFVWIRGLVNRREP